jgi:hypothetical protein
MSNPKFIIPSVTLSAREELRIIKIPSNVTQEERMLIMAAWISTLSAGDPSHLEIVECIFNLMLMGVPEMSSITNSFTSLLYTPITPTRGDLLTWIGAESEGLTGQGERLPVVFSPVKEQAYAVTKEESVYIALSSILFCLGKQASESAKASVIDNRPDALLRRFKIPESDQVILPGREAGPSRELLEAVYNAFSNYTEVRGVITTFFLAIKREAHHLPLHLEIMMNNFQLMRGAGMTHVEAVMRLAQSHPWTLKVPELQSYYHKFMVDLEKYGEVEEDVRPYHRLLVPQSQFLFLSSELRPLIAVAGSFHEDIEKTFSGYVYNKANYIGLIEKVKSYAPNYRPTSSLTRLASLLGVTEVDLPERKEGKGPDEEETV